MTKILTQGWINQWNSLSQDARTNQIWMMIVNNALFDYVSNLKLKNQISFDKNKITNQTNIHTETLFYTLLNTIINPHVLLVDELDFIFKDKTLTPKEINHLDNTLKMYLNDPSFDLNSYEFNIDDMTNEQNERLKESFEWIKLESERYDLNNNFYVIKKKLWKNLYEQDNWNIIIENINNINNEVLDQNSKEILINDFNQFKNDVFEHLNPKNIIFKDNKPIKQNKFVIKGR